MSNGGGMKLKILFGSVILTVLSLNGFAEDEGLKPAYDAIKVLRPGEVSFKNDVQPILHDYCVSCHSPGGKGLAKSGLDLSSYEGIMKGTVYGPVIVNGNSELSTFTKLLTGTNKGLKMPMGLNSTGTLDRQYILTLMKWVQQGAKNN